MPAFRAAPSVRSLRFSRLPSPGLLVLSAWLLLDGGTIRIVWPQIWLVALSGMLFTLGTLALYAALAIGPMSIVAPIAGSFPALALVFAVVQGAWPSLMQWLAIGAVMAGVGRGFAEWRAL